MAKSQDGAGVTRGGRNRCCGGIDFIIFRKIFIQEDTAWPGHHARRRQFVHNSERLPMPDIVTPREPNGEELAEILQMAEDSARRNMDKIRPQMEKAIRGVFDK